MNPYLKWTWRNKLTWRLLQWRFDHWAKRHIMGGPFKGMRFLNTSINSALFPKYLGIYELELHPLLNHFTAAPVKRMLNIGAGEGYYSVGALFAGMAQEVVAYESDSRSPAMIRELCQLNDIKPSRIITRGQCTLDELRSVTRELLPELILADIEGAEVVLLDPLRVHALKHIDLIVEVHDFIVDGICTCLSERFAGTHSVQIVNGVDRCISTIERCDDAILSRLPRYCREYALTEFRPEGMKWLWLRSLLPRLK